MESVLKISLCQYDVIWNDPLANFSIIEELTSDTEEDILFLPEMFSTGYFCHPEELNDPLALKTKKWLEVMSNKKLILGSCPNKVGENYYNSIFGYFNQQQLFEYQKKHTYIGSERENYKKGNKASTFHFKEWKISSNICYDLRFPVWCRSQNADLMFFSANWPTKRIDHWKTLLKARAIENQCYVVGVNRIGTDNNDWDYNGQSIVFDFEGKEILNLESTENVQTIEISLLELRNYRKEFPFLQDKDNFTLTEKTKCSE